MNARDGIVRYPSGDADAKRQVLAFLESELRQAYEACQSLRSRQ